VRLFWYAVFSNPGPTTGPAEAKEKPVYPFNYDSASELSAYIKSRGMGMQKRFGQNFLVSRNSRERIVHLLGAQPGEKIWEIGPGLGSVTHLLVEKGFPVVVFEIDHGFISALGEIFPVNSPDATAGGIRIVDGDFMKTWKGEYTSHGAPDRVVGNLPYNCASQIIAEFVENAIRPPMVVTVQKEMAQRMAARVGEKNYSAFSVLIQLGYTVKLEADLKSGCFYPAPDVTSTIVTLTPRSEFPAEPGVIFWFLALTSSLFSSRRKTIRNNIRSAGRLASFDPADVDAAFAKAGVDPGSRAETLPPETFLALARALADLDEGQSRKK